MSLQWRSNSISARLTRMNVLVSATALILAFVSFVAMDFVSYRQNLVQSLEMQAQILGANTASSVLFDDVQTAQTTLSALASSPSVVSAVLLTPDGRPFAAYRRRPGDPLPEQPAWNPSDRTSTWTRGARILLGHRIVLEHRSVGTLYILSETGQVWGRVGVYAAITAAILVLCLAFALVLTSKLRAVISSPLANLSDTARRVSKDNDYSLRALQPLGSDEVAELVSSFNHMLEEIQGRDLELQQSREALETRVQARTSELSSANKELEAFSYSVAHDLRGPLEAIGNIAYLLQTSPSRELNGEARENAAHLPPAVDRMNGLINDLLNLSRARRAELYREPIDLGEMANTVLQELRKNEPGRRVHVTIVPGARVIGDKGLMYLVMYNLICNAWKYTSKVNDAQITFTYETVKRQRVFSVCDNGAGFDPQFSSRLFRPFERLHTQSEFPGTGVGLATVERIVQRHGGAIWAEGQLGAGATFFFTIPNEA